MIKKTGKQIKLKINGFNAEIGTTKSQFNRCSYLLYTGYVKPVEGDLNKHIRTLETRLRFHMDDCVKQLLSDVIDPNMPIIRILEVSDSTVASNATRVNNSYTYFCIDITLYFKKHTSLDDVNIQDKLKLVLYSIGDLLEENRELVFHPVRLKVHEAVL